MTCTWVKLIGFGGFPSLHNVLLLSAWQCVKAEINIILGHRKAAFDTVGSCGRVLMSMHRPLEELWCIEYHGIDLDRRNHRLIRRTVEESVDWVPISRR
jgi:hypothetical protein